MYFIGHTKRMENRKKLTFFRGRPSHDGRELKPSEIRQGEFGGVARHTTGVN